MTDPKGYPDSTPVTITVGGLNSRDAQQQEAGAAAERARLRPLIKAAREAVVHNVDPDHAMWTPIADAFDALETAVGEPCPECEAIGEHESTCRESPNWEPSDDDLDLNGERNGAEAERRALRDAGRDRGGVW